MKIGKIAIAAMAGAIGITALVSGAAQADSNTKFAYDNYPASFTNTSTCSKADVVTDSFRIGSWVGTDLSQAPTITGGTKISWNYHTTNPACKDEKASLAFYAKDDVRWSNTDQTLVTSNTQSLGNSSYALEITVPAAFTGPYQLDAVVGKPLQVVGPDGNYYGGVGRSVQSDDRNMLVSAVSGTNDKSSLFPDTTTKDFDYVGYPNNQLVAGATTCTPNAISDAGTGLGFYINGVFKGNDIRNSGVVLAAGDVVEYRFTRNSDTCANQNLSLALYRNPDGGNGLIDTRVNQRLVTSETKTIGGINEIITLKITVPNDFRGGYQLDAVLGKPLPVVGDAGSTYGSRMLKKTNYNILAGS